ncbi:hypothetical protein [Mycolicibacterium aichiense]|uniref:Uncharacterized protein n=1 Tax=Mycolicibacterium aichiense TaxID=1799 RepID=A0AAD1HKQ8_9MYCO|nr:hypothetical protein [Mycolicibacterium aichiense]MCV7018440.1 hypothetical protein [Mycolicibacterium aichiense]BBX07195.1 hypothetical protein MAIC_19980 [Mycolicibacterium aichiense]STZ81010.1 Uncharacterised protein [Mycolicibacterium aichiense]
MTLTDPRDALADKSDFIGYLVGLAALTEMVRALASDTDPGAAPVHDCDDFGYALLGLASIGSAVERMAACSAHQLHTSPTGESAAPATRFLR